MSLPEFTKQLIESELSSYCEQRVPLHVRNQVKLTYRIRGNSVTLIEQRRSFQDRSTWIEIPISQFRYNPDKSTWTLYCAHCHPRDGVYGRRQILGPEGEFGMASRHISGMIEDEDCLLCHDNSRHRSGLVSLVDPDSGGKKPWTGNRTEFCLTCHDGDPPANVSFPAKSTGSGIG